MKDPLIFIEHILESIQNVENHIKGYSKEKFLHSQKTKDAVIRNIEILGEAAKNIPEPFRQEHIGIPWREMIRTRDKVIHDYFGVDWDIVWDVIKRDLPGLKEKIIKILEKK